MTKYIREGAPGELGFVRSTLVPGTILAAETVAAVAFTLLAVGAMLYVTESLDPLARFLLLLVAFAFGGGLAAAMGNVPLPEPIRKWAEPWASGS